MEKILEMASKKAEQAEVFSLSVTKVGVGFQADHLKRIDTKESSGFALRLVSEGRLGFGVSSDFDRAEELVEKTLSLAKFGEEVGYELPGAFSDAPDLGLGKGAVQSVSVEDMVNTGRGLIDRLKTHDDSIKAGCGLGWALEEVSILNSRGFEGRYERGTFGAAASAEMVEEGNLLNVYEVAGGLSPLEDYGFLVNQCTDKLDAARKNVPLSAGKYRVILSPAAMADVLTAFTWFGANGRLAAKKMGPLVDKVGEKILDERISIVDDPHYEGALLSCPFDDEGTPTRRTPLVENGVFRSFLTDLNAASKIGTAPTGHGFRERILEKEKTYGASPNPDVSNLVLEPGDLSLGAMREGCSEGVEIHHITGILLGDMTNGDFSGNLELAYKVENGVRTGRIKDAMIGGNFYQLFSNNLVGLEKDLHHTGNFGGGTGSYYLPHLCLDDVFIASKGT